MNDILCSIYALIGRRTSPAVDERTLREHADRIFEVNSHCSQEYSHFQFMHHRDIMNEILLSSNIYIIIIFVFLFFYSICGQLLM